MLSLASVTQSLLLPVDQVELLAPLAPSLPTGCYTEIHVYIHAHAQAHTHIHNQQWKKNRS